ncbi:GNAT family N-acetyltransferase [Sunxiuqinia elliptica]|uniref:Acetyltransferase (GNAT) family protein n=1 Tax=Sunxiuqinia elliptica TaxID=655355 RepID=A0A4R6GU90_9BACT|nr:GNAT family N-acetyltransferase [Sunxiuqinia elliptica]TDN99002.1 acetyltransferase (GNAT) family protein [Sunxiuqinia elliptica]TDO56442.1 acetyltransferase (GNAT) family protein [Sunxiuqinia elliptica]
MNVISVREQPAYKDMAIAYFQKNWKGVLPVIYEDCINHSIEASAPLPQWYLLMNEDKIIGCAGLITNDFISRMDLYPWVCALFIEEQHRGNSYGSILLELAKKDSAKAGFQSLYLCTDHIGYYEKYGFSYLAQGYHPWDEESRIYQAQL